MNEEYVKVPHERLAVIIGTDGETKALIEETMDVDLLVDTEDSSVRIVSRPTTEDPLAVWKSRTWLKPLPVASILKRRFVFVTTVSSWR
jgi:ribosomal RNA assembly protein